MLAADVVGYSTSQQKLMLLSDSLLCFVVQLAKSRPNQLNARLTGSRGRDSSHSIPKASALRHTMFFSFMHSRCCSIGILNFLSSHFNFISCSSYRSSASPFLLSRSSFCFASIFVDQRVKPGFFPWDFSDSVYLSRFPFSLSSHLPYIPSPVLCASQVASLHRLSSVYTVKCPALISIGKHCKFLLTRLPSRNHVKLVESNEYRPCRESM